jgi:uncharacterized protein YukE
MGQQVAVNDHAIGQAQAMVAHINNFETTIQALYQHGESMKGHWQGRHADDFQTAWGEAHTHLKTTHEQLVTVRNTIHRIMTNIQTVGNGG